eukprot:7589514-Alexandrium_andersonii.AAC.1
MSASLVGSEMCIRDSTGALCPHPYKPQTLDKGSLCVTAKAPWKHRVCTVSYTHLTLPTICSV